MNWRILRRLLFPCLLSAFCAFSEEPGDAEFETPPEIAEEHFYSLGYLRGRSIDQRAGVTINTAGAQPGVNLVLSPHKTGAYLMDMTGATLHEWSHDLWTSWPEEAIPADIRATDRHGVDYWSRVQLLDDGELVFIHNGCGVLRMNRDSEIQWATWMRAHHDLEVLDNGHLYVLAYTVAAAKKGEPQPSRDHLVELNENGRELRRICIDDALAASPFAHLRKGSEQVFLHTNEIVVLDGAWSSVNPAFKKGNVLLSCRDISAFVVLDMETEQVVWALQGIWQHQHGPALLLPSQSMLIFDNRGNDGFSRVIEVDPFTNQVRWTFEGTPRRAFYSRIGGYMQRLPNGNTLITESTKGVAFELTQENKVVWEFVNPARVVQSGEVFPLFLVHRLATRPAFLNTSTRP